MPASPAYQLHFLSLNHEALSTHQLLPAGLPINRCRPVAGPLPCCSPSSSSAAAGASGSDKDTVSVQSVSSSDESPSSGGGTNETWIAVWRKGAKRRAQLSTSACNEGQTRGRGRFDALCTHRYSAAVHGFAARFARSDLARFVEAYAGELESVAPDSRVSLRGVSLSGGEVASAVHAYTLDSARWGGPHA